MKFDGNYDLDAFIVGGGGGGNSYYDDTAAFTFTASGGGGYYSTFNTVTTANQSYMISIGQGGGTGSGPSGGGGSGGTTSAFGETVSGGTGAGAFINYQIGIYGGQGGSAIGEFGTPGDTYSGTSSIPKSNTGKGGSARSGVSGVVIFIDKR